MEYIKMQLRIIVAAWLLLFCAAASSQAQAQTQPIQLDPAGCMNNAVPVWVTNPSGSNGGWYCSSSRAATNATPANAATVTLGNATAGAVQNIFDKATAIAGPSDNQNVLCQRRADYAAAGSALGLNSCMQINNVINQSGHLQQFTQEQSLGVFTDNYLSAANNAFAFGMGVTLNKHSTGFSQGIIGEIFDYQADGVGGAVPMELDLFANYNPGVSAGTILDIVGGKAAAGNTPKIGIGIQVGPQFRAASNATFGTGLSIGATTFDYGIDLAPGTQSYSIAALRIPTGASTLYGGTAWQHVETGSPNYWYLDWGSFNTHGQRMGSDGSLSLFGTKAGGAASGTPSVFSAAAGVLGSTINNDINIGGFHANAGNDVSLNTHLYRVAAGSDWTTTAMVLTYEVDGSFNPSGGLWFRGSTIGVGGGTSSSPGFKASGTTLKVRLADDSADAPISAASYTAAGVAGVSCTVGTLNPATAVITNGIITHC